MFKSGMGAALALALMAGTAVAGGFSIREQSAEAQGTSFAGAAAGTDGLSSMFWNPATLSNNNDKGLISESNSARGHSLFGGGFRRFYGARTFIHRHPATRIR